MSALLLFAPLFFFFEIWQIVIGERYAGVKQICRIAHPRELGLGELTAFCWSAALLAYWLWTLALLAVPLARIHALCLLAIFVLGYALRRNSRLKWLLVILTIEGAIRLGFLFSLCVLAWRRL